MLWLSVDSAIAVAPWHSGSISLLPPICSGASFSMLTIHMTHACFPPLHDSVAEHLASLTATDCGLIISPLSHHQCYFCFLISPRQNLTSAPCLPLLHHCVWLCDEVHLTGSLRTVVMLTDGGISASLNHLARIQKRHSLFPFLVHFF